MTTSHYELLIKQASQENMLVHEKGLHHAQKGLVIARQLCARPAADTCLERTSFTFRQGLREGCRNARRIQRLSSTQEAGWQWLALLQ
jgi:hypothetical protein